ncbi:MAG TPA: hypothetical protein DIU00_00055 [Phycisphaerales bacterium]|nr:hypothetical protein [Phycisphaerales bacterium]
MMILSLLKNAINEFLEAGRILDESDAAYDDDALFSKVLYVLSKRQETAAQHIFARLIKNLADRQEKAAELEEKVSSLEAKLEEGRNEFSKMGQNNYEIFKLDTKEPELISNTCAEGDANSDGYNDILIAEYSWDNFTGRVFFFYGGDDIDFSSPDMIFEGENVMNLFGNRPSVFGDVNNDGYDDIVIGAYGYNNWTGRVYIYYGGPDMDNISDLTLDGEKGALCRFGQGIAVADIDNDGFNDVVIGAQSYDNERGRVYLFWGGETMDTTADLIFEGEGYPEGKPRYEPKINKMVQGWFGRKVDASGDVNGDGYNDIVIGARYAGDKFHGTAYLFLGNSKKDMDAVCDYAFRGEDISDQMGTGSKFFDIDNDGFDDFILAARYARNSRGAVYIWWGGENFDGNKPADVVLQGEPNSNMGGDYVMCADFNSDGYGDILTGGYNYPDIDYQNGRAYVFYGNKKTLIDTDCDYIFDPEEDTKFFGFSVSGGDVNNDGHIDALIGARGSVENMNNDGQIDILTGANQGDYCKGKTFLYFGPFVTEDIQEEIKTQQALVTKIEEELSDAKQKLEDARKFVPYSAAFQDVFEGLPESLNRFFTPELEQLQSETVASIRDDSYVLHEGIRENRIGMSDIELSAYIDEWTSKIDDLESRDNRNKEQDEELETLKTQLSWFEKVKYVPPEERDTKKDILNKEMTRLRGN